MRPPAVRLVSEWEAASVKYEGREPRDLRELLIAREDRRHRSRLDEVARMGKKLELLQEFVAPLHARGIELSRYEYQVWDQGSVVRMFGALMQPEDKLVAALQELGFKQIEQKDWGRTDVVKLRHGRWLVLAIDATKSQAVTATINPPAVA